MASKRRPRRQKPPHFSLAAGAKKRAQTKAAHPRQMPPLLSVYSYTQHPKPSEIWSGTSAMTVNRGRLRKSKRSFYFCRARAIGISRGRAAGAGSWPSDSRGCRTVVRAASVRTRRRHRRPFFFSSVSVCFVFVFSVSPPPSTSSSSSWCQ